ncbi:MAG: citrate transporter [Oscillospiraceae bacterium]|nr:citrate transporter [Oscillospiraceae bacterium]MBR3474776.1 citrate transporter [Oscillospiraceae bacterium]
MSTIRSFIRREPVLLIAALAAAVSCFFVPPDQAYLGYLDLRTLALLYCLMTVVAGLRQAGLFSRLAHRLCLGAGNLRAIGILLVLLCFFSSMLITNDVALLTFVPFAVVVLGMAGQSKALIRVVVLQTVAANLGSMLTPVGNPQNLYLYSYYDMSMGSFLSLTLPIWALSLGLILLACLLLPREKLQLFLGEEPILHTKEVWVYAMLFLVCLGAVLRVLSWPEMLGAVVLMLLFFDRKILLKADFMLLLTFVAFFIFAGNLARMEAVDRLLRSLLEGREYWTSLLASQVISNVPAALLLSGFTDKAGALLLGVDVGGLGTPIASLASLIAMKLYSHSEHASTGKFLLEFTVVNLVLLVLLSLAAMWICL